MAKVLCQPVDGICSQCGGWAVPERMQRCTANPRSERPRGSSASLAVRAEVHGLGTLVESALESVGVTKSRWIAFKMKMGLPATCNCNLRKDYLNKLGEQLGDGAKQAVMNLLGIGPSPNSHNNKQEN